MWKPTFSQREHVVGHFAEGGHPVWVDGRHPEAVGGEGCQVLDVEEGRVRLGVQRLVPLTVLASLDVQGIVSDRDFVERRCPGEKIVKKITNCWKKKLVVFLKK